MHSYTYSQTHSINTKQTLEFSTVMTLSNLKWGEYAYLTLINMLFSTLKFILALHKPLAIQVKHSFKQRLEGTI